MVYFVYGYSHVNEGDPVMKAKDHIEAEIRELGDEKTALVARAGQIKAELQALIRERTDNTTRCTEIDADLSALRRALATLQEHAKPKQDPEPVPRDPVVARELQALTQPLPSAVRPRSGHAKDPLHVQPKKATLGKVVSERTPSAFAYEGEAVLLDRDKSPTVRERADLLIEAMRDHEGAMSQYAMADTMAELLDCKRQTAQTIVSQCVRVLAVEDRIIYTGQKAEAQPGGRHASPIWKINEEKD